ncbi:unnamed protein product [Blepharisma stoltei]|uniref:Uncharacterized protein n=1 Tax=Blepharisma stoltei TaxID=1481888 RepID=A0AAU9IA99_9CILI|nr:unnamed protein product [Blepharisma stoltei]
MEEELLFRVIIVGDSGVGKSCLLLRFSENTFNEQHTVTIGVEFGTKLVKINNQQVKLQIWDTAGQESFRSITRSFYRRADGVLLVYDVNSKESFEGLSYWLGEIRQHATSDIVIFLVGNQVDLTESENSREVSQDDANAYKNFHNLCGFKETSALSGFNVNETFHEFTNILYERWNEKVDKDPMEVPSLDLKTKPLTNKKNCCYFCNIKKIL